MKTLGQLLFGLLGCVLLTPPVGQCKEPAVSSVRELVRVDDLTIDNSDTYFGSLGELKDGNTGKTVKFARGKRLAYDRIWNFSVRGRGVDNEIVVAAGSILVYGSPARKIYEDVSKEFRITQWEHYPPPKLNLKGQSAISMYIVRIRDGRNFQVTISQKGFESVKDLALEMRKRIHVSKK